MDLKKKWKTLTKESKLNDLERVWAEAHATLTNKLMKIENPKTLENAKLLIMTEEPKLNEKKSQLKPPDLETCIVTTPKPPKTHRTHSLDKIKMKLEIEMLQKEVGELKHAVEELTKKTTRYPRRQYP